MFDIFRFLRISYACRFMRNVPPFLLSLLQAPFTQEIDADTLRDALSNSIKEIRNSEG